MKKRFLSLFLMLTTVLTAVTVPSTVHALSSGIGIGDYVQMGTYYGVPILWRCVDVDENGPLMLSDKILCVKPFDAKTSLNSSTGSHSRDLGSYRLSEGSDYWADSNIRSWLNSSEGAGDVVWLCGNPPLNDYVYDGYNDYADEAGFLTGFSESEIGVIKSVTQKTIVGYQEYENGVYTSGTESHLYERDIENVVQNYDSSYGEQVTDTFFLLDVKQVNAVYNNAAVLGSDYYIGKPTEECVANSEYKSEYISAGQSIGYWLRTPRASGRIPSVRCVNFQGSVQSDSAITIGGIRPAFYLDMAEASFTAGCGSEDDPYRMSGIRVYLNDEEIEFDQEPINMDGNLLVPIRAIAEAMGKTVMWSDAYNAAFIDNTDNALIIPIEDNNALSDYEKKAIFIADDGGYYTWERKQTNVQPMVINNRTLVPIRQFAEALGADVKWVDDENAAYITYEVTNGGGMDIGMYESINLNYYIAHYSENPFSEYTEVINSFYNDRNKTADAITMGLSSMFDVPSDLWRMGLYGETNASMTIQQALYDVISEIPDGGTEVTVDVSLEKDIKSYLTTAKTIYNDANGIDSDFLEAHKDLKTLNSAISSVSDLFDFTVFTAEEVAYLLSDYSESITYINALESALLRTGVLDSNMQTAINKLKLEYTEQFYQIVQDMHSETIGKTFSTALSTLTGGTFTVGKTALKIVFKASGISSNGSALETFYGLYSFNSELDAAFDLALSDVKADGLYGTTDLTQVKALFDFEVAAKKAMFSSMKTVSDWWAADTYNAMLDSLTYYVWDKPTSESGISGGGGGSW